MSAVQLVSFICKPRNRVFDIQRSFFKMPITDPWDICVSILHASAIICYALSRFTGTFSWVDRLWSLLPLLYAWLLTSFAMHARTVLMSVLVTLWSIRLTFNYARKGGYSWDAEDYRWAVVRQHLGAMRFELLNATFIAYGQQWILLMLIRPIYDGVRAKTTTITTMDAVAAVLFVGFLIIETIADEQQWRFQLKKRTEKTESGTDEARGFIASSGLFRFSRHPNFFAEQALWCSFYLFSVSATGNVVSIAILGPLLLIGVFAGSVPLTERISLSKYPSYSRYQRTTSRIVPWFPGKSLNSKDK